MAKKTKASIPLQELEALINQDGTFSVQNIRNISLLRQLWKLDTAAYSTEDKAYELSFAEFSNWWRRYSLGSKVLVVNDQIVSSIGIYPLTQDQYLSFSAGSLNENDLLPVSLKECKKTPQQYWYLSGIVRDENYVHLGLKIHPLYHLLKESLGLWLDSGHLKFPIFITAIALNSSASALLTNSGFSQKEFGKDGFPLYELELSSLEDTKSLLRTRRLI